MRASGYRGAGRLDRPAQVLELQCRPGNVWTWVPVREVWAAYTPKGKRNLFSTLGVGTAGAELVLWRQSLTLHNALQMEGMHWFLTSITRRNRNQLEVSAALVEVEDCIGHPVPPGEPVQFPGVLTEQYQGYAQGEPYAYNEIRLVLVTPKPVALIPGGLVQARGSLWHILSAHTLDPWKNEYSIARVLEH